MTQIIFTRWCVQPEGRTPVAVNPERVDCVEWYGDAFKGMAGFGEDYPAATKIIMRGKQEYIVQGSVAEVTDMLAEGKSR